MTPRRYNVVKPKVRPHIYAKRVHPGFLVLEWTADPVEAKAMGYDTAQAVARRNKCNAIAALR